MQPPANRTSALRTEIPLLFVGTEDFVASKYALEGFRPLALVESRPPVQLYRRSLPFGLLASRGPASFAPHQGPHGVLALAGSH